MAEARKSIGARRNPDSAEAILEAAEAILSEAGPSGFSIEAVARRAHAGKPTIYRWWPSKTALLLEVYHRQKRAVAAPDTGGLAEDIYAFLRGLFANWRDTPAGGVFRSVIAEAQTDAAAAEALAAYSAGRRKATGEIFVRARARGELGEHIDPEVAADMIVAYAWAHLLTGRLDDDEALRAAARLFAGGTRAK
jgi:AcrR family transcriptional regulator